MAATGKGGSYSIGSDKGKNFVSSAAAGSTMKGSDGSTWTKNSDGTTTITPPSGQPVTPNDDGSVTIPEVLWPYMGGTQVLVPKK